MSFKTETCAQCGNLFSYDDSLFGKQPEWAGGMLGGYICSNCSNQRRYEKQQEEFRKEDQDRGEMDRIRRGIEEEDRELERQKQQRIQQQQQQEYQYQAQNPGEYECPNCLYITLKRNASRCPKCQGTVNQNYWRAIEQQEALEEEKRRQEAEEWERARPAREAADKEKRAAKAKRKTIIIISSIIGPFLLSGLIAVFNGYSFSYGIEKLVTVIAMIIFIPIVIGVIILLKKIFGN